MYIRSGYELAFEHPVPTPMLAILQVHPSRENDLLHPDTIRTDPPLPVEEHVDSFNNRCARLLAPRGSLRMWSDTVVLDSGKPDVVPAEAEQAFGRKAAGGSVALPARQPLLRGRSAFGAGLEALGDTNPGWERAQAVVAWVHNHVTFGYQHARPTKTALNVLEEKQGVCRDFQHLAITFCRALNIPARYVTGYLGDIAVPFDPAPMDFSAWFEVYLGGRWWTMDARHNKPRVGRILMATGRDATDVALTTTFGSNTLTKFRVWSDEVSEPTLPAELPVDTTAPRLPELDYDRLPVGSWAR